MSICVCCEFECLSVCVSELVCVCLSVCEANMNAIPLKRFVEENKILGNPKYQNLFCCCFVFGNGTAGRAATTL